MDDQSPGHHQRQNPTDALAPHLDAIGGIAVALGALVIEGLILSVLLSARGRADPRLR